MTGRLKNLLAELRNGLEAHYGPRLDGLILFGSRARGDAKGDSDVDVLVLLKGKVNLADEIRQTSQMLWELDMKYGTLVNCIFKSRRAYDRNYTDLLWNIRADGVPI